MIDLALLAARAEFHAVADDGAACRYLRENGVSLASCASGVGFAGVVGVTGCDDGRFVFANHDSEGLRAFAVEVFDADAETVADLAAWPLARPENVMTMFARVGFAGVSAVKNPWTYACGMPLDVHRTVLDWLKAGCRGCAVIEPRLAGALLLDTPGIFAGRDDLHTRRLVDLARAAVPTLDLDKFLTASAPRRAA